MAAKQAPSKAQKNTATPHQKNRPTTKAYKKNRRRNHLATKAQ
jgi:hypothetical protein